MSPESEPLSYADLLNLLDTAKQLTSQVSLPELLATILVRAKQLTASAKASVFLYDAAQNALYAAAASGDDAAKFLAEFGEKSDKRVPMQSKAGRVFSSGEPLMSDSLVSDPEHFKGVDAEVKSESVSMVCVPMACVDLSSGSTHRIGVIQLLNKQSGKYTERDLALLGYFSDQAAVAIQNAALLRQMLSHAGLYSTRLAADLIDQLNAPAHEELLTLMFADMRGFTQLCQTINNPVEIQKLLGRFLTMVTETLLDAGGVVNKQLGDGVLAFFRQPGGPRQAVDAAFRIIELFSVMRGQWDHDYSQDLSFLDVGFGIATQRVMLGAIGSGKVRDFTAIGPGVNLAAALEKLARNGKRVMIDHGTFTAIEEVAGEATSDTFVLKKPGQDVGIRYKIYHLANLKGHAPAELRKPGGSLKIFLCHASEDKDAVRELHQRLAQDGFEPWLDKDALIGGQDWEEEIHKAVRGSDLVVVCLSERSVAKAGFLNRELSAAIDAANEQPEGAIFLVPARLELCQMPRKLTHWQWIDLFEAEGYKSLLKSLRRRAEQLRQVQHS
jgi:class 3 adenylate cyclase